MARSSQTINEQDGAVEVCAELSNPSAITIHLTFNTSDIDATGTLYDIMEKKHCI